MKIVVFAAVALLLGGCTTGPVTQSGKDTYIMSATRCGACAPVQGYVTQQAGLYCTNLGKNLVVRSITGNNLQPWVPGNATIVFSCLNSDDPAYKLPDAGATPIQEH